MADQHSGCVSTEILCRKPLDVRSHMHILNPHATQIPWVCTFAHVSYCAIIGNYVCSRLRHPIKCHSGVFNQKQLKVFFFSDLICNSTLGDFPTWVNLYSLKSPLYTLSWAYKSALLWICRDLERGCLEVQADSSEKKNAILANWGEKIGKVSTLTFSHSSFKALLKWLRMDKHWDSSW